MTTELANTLIGRTVTAVSFADTIGSNGVGRRDLTITIDDGSYVQLEYGQDDDGYERLEAGVWLGSTQARDTRLFYERVVDDPNPEDRR